MKKLLCCGIIIVLFLSACGRATPSTPPVEESPALLSFPAPDYDEVSPFGGCTSRYGDDFAVIYLAMDPAEAKRLGYYWDDAANACFLSADFARDSADFAKLPAPLQEAAHLAAEEYAGEFEEHAAVRFRLVKYPLAYLEEIWAIVMKETQAHEDEAKSPWNMVKGCEILEEENKLRVNVFCAGCVPPGNCTEMAANQTNLEQLRRDIGVHDFIESICIAHTVNQDF